MDASRALRELSMPQMRGEKIAVIIERCARITGLSYSRCYEIYYRRARRIEQAEIARISEVLKQKSARDARNELSELRIRLARLEAVLSVQDAEFHRPHIGALRDTLR